MNLTDQSDILLLNRFIQEFRADSHFTTSQLANKTNSPFAQTEKVVTYLRTNNFVKTGIFSVLQREENSPQALLTLTDKGLELVSCNRYENYLKKVVDEEKRNVQDKLKMHINLAATIIGAIAAVVAAVASIWALLK